MQTQNQTQTQTMSYVCGVSDVPLAYQTIGDALRSIAAAHPDSDALISLHQNIRYSWAEFDRLVDDYARGLLALGLEAGDRLGIWSPNNVEWILAQFATARVGIILVNVNPAYRVHELEYALNKTGCKAVICADRFKTSDYPQMLRSLAPEIAECGVGALQSKKLPHLKLLAVIGEASDGFLPFAAIADAHRIQSRPAPDLAAIAARLSPEDPINIQFTSGTTGLPKGATLTHHNILNNALFTGERMRITARDRICIPVPLYHCFGMVLGVLTCVSTGAAIILPDESFEPLSVLRAVQAEKCTALYGVPTMFIAELDHPQFGEFDMSSLRTGIMAGSPCPVRVMRRVIAEMNMKDVTIGYGMTELSPLSFQSTPEDDLEARVSSVGQAHPYVETKIVDPEGRVVPRGVQGEVLSRGYSVMRGYWDDDERTAEARDSAGWMHTGDLGVIDERGYLAITGRAKDMIIRGGENIYPREIEEFLYSHPDIADVQVFGVPDEKYGELVCCWILLKPDAVLEEADVRDFCRDKIAHFKIPTHVRFVTEFPLTVTGKVQKFIMREQMIAELGL